MSWGERSCKKLGKCGHATFHTCNVDCCEYEWDTITEPDSEPHKTQIDNNIYVLKNHNPPERQLNRAERRKYYGRKVRRLR